MCFFHISNIALIIYIWYTNFNTITVRESILMARILFLWVWELFVDFVVVSSVVVTYIFIGKEGRLGHTPHSSKAF